MKTQITRISRVFQVLSAGKQAFLIASLTVASLSSISAANAQYMVIEGGSCNAKSESQIICQSMYVQDYSSFSGVSSAAAQAENELTSTQIINGLFDGYIGVFSAVIGIPAIIIAVLRLFVRGQNERKPKKKSFSLPAAPEPARYYRPSLAGKY